MSDRRSRFGFHTLHGERQAPSASQPPGEVEHVDFLSENIGALYENADYSDITIVVENHRFNAHKVILAARSDYFRALLFGGMRESSPGVAEIELKDTRPGAFRYLLKYIYTGKVNLLDMKEEEILDVLGLAHQYGFVDLESAISNYLKAVLNIKNVCLIYDISTMYSLGSLAETCFEFMDRNAQDIIASESFLSLSENALCEVISRDSFCAPESEIFNAVCRWHERNPDSEIHKVMANIRLMLMSIPELLNSVRPTSLVSSDAILDAIKYKTEKRDMELNYRGFLTPNINIATPQLGAQVIEGEMKAALLDGDFHIYDLDRGFTRHPLDPTDGEEVKGIVVMLANPSIINSINLLLWDRDMRSYSYYIEVSMDQKDWVRIIDHTRYLCRSWQTLRFPACVVKCIKIVGTSNTVNRVFHAVAFECMYETKPVQLQNGLTVPEENIATIQQSACVIEGVSRSRNALINGNTKNYDWDSGYTCHQLGSGAIVVQLAQPYIVGSMRLLLWDCDDRSYRYKILVSVDQRNWSVITDKTKEDCQSWQYISFTPRPVTFIKIVGTHNTANEVFHCVHFECPAVSASNTPPPMPRHNSIEDLRNLRMSRSSVSVPFAAPPPLAAAAQAAMEQLPGNQEPPQDQDVENDERQQQQGLV